MLVLRLLFVNSMVCALVRKEMITMNRDCVSMLYKPLYKIINIIRILIFTYFTYLNWCFIWFLFRFYPSFDSQSHLNFSIQAITAFFCLFAINCWVFDRLELFHIKGDILNLIFLLISFIILFREFYMTEYYHIYILFCLTTLERIFIFLISKNKENYDFGNLNINICKSRLKKREKEKNTLSFCNNENRDEKSYRRAYEIIDISINIIRSLVYLFFFYMMYLLIDRRPLLLIINDCFIPNIRFVIACFSMMALAGWIAMRANNISGYFKILYFLLILTVLLPVTQIFANQLYGYLLFIACLIIIEYTLTIIKFKNEYIIKYVYITIYDSSKTNIDYNLNKKKWEGEMK